MNQSCICLRTTRHRFRPFLPAATAADRQLRYCRSAHTTTSRLKQEHRLRTTLRTSVGSQHVGEGEGQGGGPYPTPSKLTTSGIAKPSVSGGRSGRPVPWSIQRPIPWASEAIAILGVAGLCVVSVCVTGTTTRNGGRSSEVRNASTPDLAMASTGWRSSTKNPALGRASRRLSLTGGVSSACAARYPACQ